MKILKGLVFTLFALLLTGCYTQLQYTQKMKKVTDRPQQSRAVYSSDEQQQPAVADTEAEAARYDEEYAGYDQQEDYVPIYYKDYDYARKYDECGCNPYNVYNFYGYDYDPYYSYSSPLTLDPFYFHRWHHNYYPRYYRPYWGTSLSLSFYWGTPYYHRFYYDPFYYDYYWDYYWGYPRSLAFNYIYFYGNYGHGYYGYKNNYVNRQNVRYGPRSIGTDRVRSDGSRSRDSRSASVRNSNGNISPDIRTRIIGTSRTRGSETRNSGANVGSPRSRGTSQSGTVQSGNSRSRSRVEATHNSSSVDRNRARVQSDRSPSERRRVIRSRNVDYDNRLRRISDPSEIRRNLDKQRAPRVRINPNTDSRHRSSFFNRMKGFFERSAVQLGRNIGNSGTVRFNSRSKSRSRSSAVSRSSSRSRSSSVSRSSSSNHQTRSRSGSSSRSRSGSSSSNDSSRSRGNN